MIFKFNVFKSIPRLYDRYAISSKAVFTNDLLAKTYVRGSLKWFMEAFPLSFVTREIGCLSKSKLQWGSLPTMKIWVTIISTHIVLDTLEKRKTQWSTKQMNIKLLRPNSHFMLFSQTDGPTCLVIFYVLMRFSHILDVFPIAAFYIHSTLHRLPINAQ